MEEKQRSPVNPLLLRIRTSIASLRSTSYATNYHLIPLPTISPNTSSIPPTTFRYGRGVRTILFPPHFVRRKWGYIGFILLVLFIVIVRLQFAKRGHVPFEEIPAVTGHTKESKQQTRPLPPIFSTFTDNYPKQLAILIFTSSNISLDTFSKSIINTWGKIAKQNKSLSVDLWFVTPKDTLKKFGWPNIPYNGEEVNKFGFEESDDDNGDDEIIESGNKKGLEKELKEMLRESFRETLIFKDLTELSNEEKEFQRLTKALHYLYENHLDHYNYILKITDKTFVRLPKLLEFLSILNNTENNFLNMRQPKLIGRPNLDRETTKNFCFKGSGYIINKNLLTMIGPHLPFCLATIIKNSDTKENDLQEDLAIERCFKEYVPMFKGCEPFFSGDDDNDNLKKSRGYEFLYLRPDDEINWDKYKEPLEMFNDGYINGWRFADAIVMGEVQDPSNMIKLEEWYGQDGKFDELVKEMGGVIPEPIPIQEEKHDKGEEKFEDMGSVETSNENVSNETNETNEQSQVTIMTAVPTETSNENVNDEKSSTFDDSVLSTKLPIQEEEQIENSKNIIYTTDSISTSTLEETTLPQTKINQEKQATTTDNGNSDNSANGYDDDVSGNRNGDDELLSLKNGEELAEP